MSNLSDWKSGLALAVLAAFTWGTLPMALKVALREVDPLTLTFLRFFQAFVLSWIWLLARGRGRAVWSEVGGLSPRRKGFLMAAGAALTVNYVAFVWGVDYATPANSQLFIQLSPLMFGTIGVVFFKEQMSGARWLGVAMLLAGLGLFYRDQVEQLSATLANYKVGCLWLLLAAVGWAIYAVFQKLLNQHMKPFHVTTWVYLFAIVALLPVVNLSSVLTLRGLPLLATVYCGLNTIVAYAAFAEAIHRWEASRVSAVLPLTPVFTMLLMPFGAGLLPQYLEPERVAGMGWLGVALVLSGSTLSALSRVAQSEQMKTDGPVMAGNPAHHEQMPNGVTVAQPLPGVKGDSGGVEDSASKQPQSGLSA